MNDLISATEFADVSKVGAFAAWLITVLFIATGFQRIKEVIAFVLMKLYEFFIQKNAVKL